MLGGYQIINLSNIDLTIGTSQVSITDKDVLAQLRELREHIEDNYNFIVPLNRKLKPVLLRLRDKKNGEKQEVSVWANLSIITNNKTFKIEALVDSVSMKAIQIEVVFQQLTDDDGNPYWDIKTAKYLYTENIGTSGDLEVGGDIDTTGDVSVGGDLIVTGSINGEENPSVKPIYEHIISIQGEGGNYPHTKITLVLFRNDNTSITKDTIISIIAAINKRLPVDGYLVSEAKVYNVSFISTALNVLGLASDDTPISLSLATILEDSYLNINDDIIKLN